MHETYQTLKRETLLRERLLFYFRWNPAVVGDPFPLKTYLAKHTKVEAHLVLKVNLRSFFDGFVACYAQVVPKSHALGTVTVFWNLNN